ncbi:hypothetical protein QQS21_010711 [Conoideocrella luteorostrata]|uniref:PRISE-like Rossmann-fold domain-containing protein n=1 Tax=Conoideocrella luteorostrata TaxID=1105319 RepID=A0AAJ0FUE2_9HYPO|nr:hypothetical protein QQS21_010711 [Conoideocrella luteorostrata]
MTLEPKHAVVFGASGLLGWSVLSELLSGYSPIGTFSKVTAIVNRPVSETDLCLAGASVDRPELQIVSGVNLLEGTQEDLGCVLKDQVSGADTITHAFYFVFNACSEDHIRESRLNCDMMRRVAGALNIVAPCLKSITYSGGTRGYGIYVPGGSFAAPLEEKLADQLPEDYAKTVAYPRFRQILTEASHGRVWTWTEVCPDAVVGFSPNGSGYSLALHWAQYLSLYAHNHGVSPGSDKAANRVEVPFPGCDEAANCKFTPVSGRMLGRISIHAALNPDKYGQKVVNMVDSDTPVTYGELWPKIAAWFGLVGSGPQTDGKALKPGQYVARYKHIFEERGLSKALTAGVGAGSAQLDSVGWWLTFDRQLSPQRLRSLGFEEQRDPVEGWHEAFAKLREAGIII